MPQDAPADGPRAVAHDLADALSRRLDADGQGPVRRVDTHLSTLLLAREHAYKLKKPVTLDFVDFGSLQRRRHFCEEELRINRRTAPGLYLDVLPVTGTPQEPVLGGEGPVIDHVLRMRRFPDDAVMDAALARGAVRAAHVDRLARRLAALHASAARADPADGHVDAAACGRAAQRVLHAVEALAPDSPTDGLADWLRAQEDALAPLWARRLAQGWVREGHGDLHLGNVVLLDGDPVPFDAIEFDPALRWIDTLSDAGFLVMDLLAHRRGDLAFRFLNAYLDEAGGHDGLPALRHVLVYRALVRALAALLRIRAGVALPSGPDYLALARDLVRHPGDPRLLLTHGLPGSGKTWHSQGLLEQVGAIRLRSDVERKRLYGLRAQERSAARVPGGIYGADATARTYDRLLELAACSLRAGYPTIVDAAFLRRDERARFEALAAGLRLPFGILDCQADDEVLRERVRQREQRGEDASEAGVEVLERLRAAREPLNEQERACAIVADAGRTGADPRLAAHWLAQPSPAP